MLVTYTHSRAAILCLGGWGLQVMLHLAPRLLGTQEQRAALNAQGPDLQRITSFGAVMAEPLLVGNRAAQLHLRRLQSDVTWPPFHVERLLAEIQQKSAAAGDDSLATLLTAGERRAIALMRAAEPMLQPMGYDGYEFTAPAAGLASLGMQTGGENRSALHRATRSEMFATALTHADYVARLLETHVLDPIRQDNLAPDDPFVQTTLYVVAPLFEPLTSTLIWPLVGALMARMGRRHISNVVGLFATGSYATDLTRSVEDAATYAALAELETLTGMREEPERLAALSAQIQQQSTRGQLDYIGQRLFDRIYLLDREKANQGLAEDSHELAILAGNALEALVVGSGDLYIQEQIGFTVHNGAERIYSLIGAAGDYVPVNQILHAVNRQEESRLVREWVLSHAPEEGSTRPLSRILPPAPAPSLAELGFGPERALKTLVARIPELYTNPEPKKLKDLAVAQSFVYPPATAHELRRLGPSAWPEAFERHLDEIGATFELAVGNDAATEAWGLDPSKGGSALGFTAGLEADDRLYPRLLTQMHHRLVDMLADSPTGLIHAAEQTDRWLHEAEETQQKLLTFATPSTRQLNRIQHELALREWRTRYTELATKRPSLVALLLRAVGATALVGLLSLLYLVFAQRGWSAADGWTLAGFGVGIFVVALMTYRIHRTRQSRARWERIELAQTELTRRLQHAAHDGLLHAYSQLVSVLQGWQQMLREAKEELQTLSTPPEMPAVPPPDVAQSYLYMPHFSQSLWDRCLAYLRRHLDEAGQRSEERLDKLWGTAKWRATMNQVLRAIPNRSEANEEAHGRDAGKTAGRFSDSVQGNRVPGRSIAEFIRQTVHESVAPVSLQEANPIRDNLIQALADEFSIEHLLWRGNADAQDLERRLRAMSLELADGESVVETNTPTNRRYVEAGWNRAKPTGNYDVADRLAVYGITVDFAAASGKAESDLTRALLNEFNVSLLPTENPFTILFIRTVHGLSLDDLDCMRRYFAEQQGLTPDERLLIQLVSPFGKAAASRTKWLARANSD